jgi:hypothetical protein
MQVMQWIWRSYRRLYFGYIGWHEKAHGPRDLPELSALLLFAVIAAVNTLTVAVLFYHLAGVDALGSAPRLLTLALTGAYSIIHWWVFWRRSDAKGPRGAAVSPPVAPTLAVWAYIVGSFGCFLAIIAVLGPVR